MCSKQGRGCAVVLRRCVMRVLCYPGPMEAPVHRLIFVPKVSQGLPVDELLLEVDPPLQFVPAAPVDHRTQNAEGKAL